MKKYDLIFKSKVQSLKQGLPKILLDEFLKDKANQGMLLITGVLFSIAWILSLYFFRVNDFLVPTRYNSFLGVTELGNWAGLYRIPLFLTVLIIINLLLGNLIYKKDRMITYILIGTNIFLALISIVLVINFSNIIGKS